MTLRSAKQNKDQTQTPTKQWGHNKLKVNNYRTRIAANATINFTSQFFALDFDVVKIQNLIGYRECFLTYSMYQQQL